MDNCSGTFEILRCKENLDFYAQCGKFYKTLNYIRFISSLCSNNFENMYQASAKKLWTILLENVNKQNFAVLMAKDLPITLAKNCQNFLNSMFTVWAKKWKFVIKCSEENVRLKFARLEMPVLKRLSNHQLWDV